MEDGERPSTLTLSPSLRDLGEGDDDRAVPFFHQDSPPQISAVDRPDEAVEGHRDGDGDGDDSSDDFEFACVLKDPEADPSITADEIFSNGRICPVYPVFGRSMIAADEAAEALPPKPPVRMPLRRLFFEERSSSAVSASTSSSMDELDGIPEETYCVWTPGSVPPTPARCRKSRSTGSLMRWRRISELVHRSQSDGKEKFVFFSAGEEERKENPNPSRDKKSVKKGEEKEAKEKEKAKGSKGGKVAEVDMVTAHRIFYGKGANQRVGARKSFLPYRQDIVGFFANVNGLSRAYHHPF